MWKEINGTKGIYLIDEYGNVFNTKLNSYMKYYLNNKGYKCIDLTIDGVKHKYTIHRLVALHFVDNPNNFPIVLHLDNNKLNTHYSNLKWGTYSENNAQAIHDGLNTVPRPDNRKDYRVFNGEFSRAFHGISSIIEEGNYGTDSIMRNNLFRNSPIKDGKFKGCMIEQVTIITPIRFV